MPAFLTRNPLSMTFLGSCVWIGVCFVLLQVYIRRHPGRHFHWYQQLTIAGNEFQATVKRPKLPPIYHQPRLAPRKVVTIFSTFKPSEDKLLIYRNTLANWAHFSDRAHLIYFYNEEEGVNSMQLMLYAVSLGWDLRKSPKVFQGIPVLRYMFLAAQQYYNTPYYGYANGDILFQGLIHTLDALYDYQFTQVLMVGRRTNVNVSPKVNLTSHDLQSLAQNGSLFAPDALDYFITTRHGYPWESIPDFVVGRVAYDNWLVLTALERGIPVIDMTRTLLAIHQTDHHGNYEGSRNKTEYDNKININMVAPRFNFTYGQTECSHFYTIIREGKLHLLPRIQLDCHVFYKRNAIMIPSIIERPTEVTNTTSTESHETFSTLVNI